MAGEGVQLPQSRFHSGHLDQGHDARVGGARFHHFATKQFVRHEERERKNGRSCPADWAAIVPATSGSTTPVWQRRHEPTRERPTFSPHQVPWSTGSSAPGAVIGQ
ncbi:nitric oxide synthase oxygenase [Kitasatospora mediocidica]|uniref:nitric oxide synthase oxygenase n=1 Tax=Kitasatospora mediocidica TaxID=58352 RepID=UPI000A01126D